MHSSNIAQIAHARKRTARRMVVLLWLVARLLLRGATAVPLIPCYPSPRCRRGVARGRLYRSVSPRRAIGRLTWASPERVALLLVEGAAGGYERRQIRLVCAQHLVAKRAWAGDLLAHQRRSQSARHL
jgi:hypothetical protein